MKEIELVEKRGPNTKHFLQEDGTIIARVYSNNIHYLKDGKYEEIDNTLVKQNDEYKNKNNDYRVSFKPDGKDSLMRMERNDDFLNIKIKQSNYAKLKKSARISKLSENVLYPEIVDDVDIEYKTLPTKVKETIILKKNSVRDLTFLIDTNLELVVENGAVKAKNSDGSLFTIEKPYMEDSNGVINDNIYYELSKIGETYEIKLILDTDWLDSATRVYPVYVDPTITDDKTSIGLMDTYIYEGDTATVRYDKDILKAGVERINNTDIINRTLIKFSLPEIGTGSEVIKAVLTLCGYVTHNNSSTQTSKLVEIHRITEPWDEQYANWANMTGKFDSKVEGVQFVKRSWIEGNEIVPQYSSDQYGDITDLVKHWYKDTENYGLMIKSIDEVYVDENYPAFYSKNHSVPNANPEPVLEISYRNQNGLEDYWDYVETKFNDGSTYTNTYNGNLVGVFNIASTIGSRLPVTLNLVYNTNDVIINNNGFKFNLLQTIEVLTIGDTVYYKYLDDNNTAHFFKNTQYRVLKNVNNVPEPGIPYNEEDYYEIREYISDEDGLMLKLELIDNEYVITDKYNNALHFSKNNVNDDLYYLKLVKDSENNQVQIIYNSNNKITKVIDSNDDEITLEYIDNNIIVTSPLAQTTISFSGNNIISITSINGVTQFNYDNHNIISSILDSNGMKVCYQYYDVNPYRIKNIVQYGLNNSLGRTTKLNYGFNETKVTFDDNITNTILFNSSGNKISTNTIGIDGNISNAYSTYENVSENVDEEYYSKNKIKSKNSMVRYVNNFLMNTSFEANDDNFIVTSNLAKSYDNNYYVTGDKSLKLESSNANQVASYSINVPNNQYYTFSGYFKSNNDFIISLSYYDGNNQLIEENKTVIASENFDRNNVTIFYDGDASSALSVNIKILSNNTITYVDDVQLEIGEVVNYYNMIDNSNFSNGFSEWIGNLKNPSLQDTYEVVTINDTTALKIDLKNSNSISRTLPIKGRAGDVYDISFWIKNSGIYSDGSTVINNVEICYNPVDETQTLYQTFIPQFVPNADWQFIDYKDVAAYDFKSITIRFVHQNQFNNLYITNLFFYKDLNTMYYNYDNYGNLISTNDSNSARSTFNYDENNRLISTTNPVGANHRFEYDNVNKKRVISAVSGEGISNKIKYDANGNPISIKSVKSKHFVLADGVYTIRNKGTNRYLKFVDGRILMVTDPCSNTVYNLSEVLDSEYIPTGEYTINLAGNTSAYFKYSNAQLVVGTIDNEISQYGNSDYIFKITEKNNGSFTIEVKLNDNDYGILKVDNDQLIFDALGDSNNSECQFYFEFANEPFIETDATYTQNGKFITSITDSLLNKEQYNVDPTTGLVSSYTNANNNVINYQYDLKNRISSISQSNKQVIYDYNTSNLLSKITQGSKEYNLEYDDFLNLKKVMLGNDVTLITNGYANNNGNLISTKFANNDIILYEYDDFERIKSITKMDNIYSYKYNSVGHIGKIKSNNSVKEYCYDNSSRIIKYLNDNFEIKYDYNSNNQVVLRNYKYNNLNHSIYYALNKDNNILEMEDLGNSLFQYQYDNLGRLDYKKINNSYITEYSYLHLGNRTINVLKSIQNGNDKYVYKYDKMYNIKKIYHNNDLIKQYTYDEYNQLVSEDDLLNSKVIEYNYDVYGNIVTIVEKDYNTNNVLNTITYTYANSAWLDQLTNYNGTTITYDQTGNPLTIGDNITMTWINGREMSSYSDSQNGINAVYKYDENGIRTAKIVNNISTQYYLEGNKIIYEQRGNSLIYYMYDLTGPCAIIYNNNVYYFIKNVQNDVIGILDSNYNKVVSYLYDSWGNTLSIKDSIGNEIVDPDNIGLINPFRYRSYYYDSENGYYYLNSRYYNPKWCRFISADRIIGTIKAISDTNLYCYTNNNPVNSSDITGEAISLAIGALYGVAAIFGVVAGYYAARAAVQVLVPPVIAGVNDFVNTIHRDNSRSKSKTANEPKILEDTRVLPFNTPMPSANDDKVIYRYGYEDLSKLVPTLIDVQSDTGLSFSTNPRPGSAVTTINTVNSTGILQAVEDKPGHVSVTPVNGSLAEWRAQGVDSIWTQTLAGIVVKLD